MGKKPCCWKRLNTGGEGDDRGCSGWMASSTQWTWVWASSRRQWRTGKPAVHGLQRVRHNWVSEWTTLTKTLLWELKFFILQWRSWSNPQGQSQEQLQWNKMTKFTLSTWAPPPTQESSVPRKMTQTCNFSFRGKEGVQHVTHISEL